MIIKQYINQQFPYPGIKWKRNVLFLSAFVTIFLLIFQPIEGPLPFKQPIIIGFGLIAFFIGSLLHLIVPKLFPALFNVETWTIKKHLLWFAVQLSFIGIANYFYALYFLPSHPNGLEGLILFQLRAYLLGVFPITIDIVVTRYFLLSQNLKEAVENSNTLIKPDFPFKTEDRVRLVSDNERDSMELSVNELVFIESVGNYVQVYFYRNGTVKISVLRCSLKRIENLLTDRSEVLKCHRAYLVNIKNVSRVRGNSLGFRLSFEGCDKEIPVSRNYTKIVKEKLDTLNPSI